MALEVEKLETLLVKSDVDIVAARRVANEWARDIGLSPLDRTKMVTAASELARNTVVYGGGGLMFLEVVHDSRRTGLRITFNDQGPGIANVDRALEDGYSTGGSLGLGLPGARRLVNEFTLDSTVGVGTRVTILRWKA